MPSTSHISLKSTKTVGDGWPTMSESHRADLHQVLAYTSLFEADEITATLAYPLRQDTWMALKAAGPRPFNRRRLPRQAAHFVRALGPSVRGARSLPTVIRCEALSRQLFLSSNSPA